ncbi:MFS transporter (plasmid) [Bacillus cereus]|uniref:MFS transporter n=1 Tax=Bacillus cereus TaxID=1396 RepID=UPI00156132AB|nr:MFS transporter [Bacillus cereus]QKH04688.1 MFS transporter [Bacillus cereus]QKH10741.1 MFS transporter [Bacillus cereus]HDR8161718.1 MFS transporter [Bacillus cereus]
MSYAKDSKWKNVLALLTIIIGYSMALLDTTIVNITLPKMTEFYNTDVKTISWVLNGYNLSFAVLLITMSRLADQFGRKKVFLIGVGLFTLSSYLCGVADNVHYLITFRVIQGMAAAMLVPVTLPMSLLIVSKEKRGLLMGIWGVLGGLASASGPALGGFLSENFSWQWIFYINIPAGIITILLTAILIHESYDETASKKIDWVGMSLLTVSMFTLTLALIQVNDYGWTSTHTLSLLTLGIITLVSFFIVEAKTDEPMLPLWLFKIRAFSAGTIGMFILTIGMVVIAFLVTFYLTMMLGMSQQEAGNIIAVMPLTSMFFAGAVGPLSQKFGSRWFSIIGLAVMGFAIYLCGGLTLDSTRGEIIWRMIIAGVGLGIAMTPMMMASMQAVPADKYGVSSGVNVFSRTLAQVIGVAVLVTIFNSYISMELSNAKSQVKMLVQSNTQLNDQVKSTLLSKLSNTQEYEKNSMSIDDIIAQMEKEKKVALAKAPSSAQMEINKQFKQQEDAMKEVIPEIGNIYKTKLSQAYADTFKSASGLLLIGIISSYFLEPVRRKKKGASSIEA